MLEEYRRGAGGRGGMLEGYIGEVEVGGVGCWRSIGEVKVGGEDVGGSLVPSPSAPPVLIACSMQKRRGKAWGIFSCDTRHDRHMLSRGLTISRNGTDRNGPEHHTIPRNGHASSRRSSYTAQCAHENLLVGVRNEAAMMATVYSVCTTPLPISEVTKLLHDPPEEGISSLPPVKAKAGEIYLYKPRGDLHKGKE